MGKDLSSINKHALESFDTQDVVKHAVIRLCIRKLRFGAVDHQCSLPPKDLPELTHPTHHPQELKC